MLSYLCWLVEHGNLITILAWAILTHTGTLLWMSLYYVYISRSWISGVSDLPFVRVHGPGTRRQLSGSNHNCTGILCTPWWLKLFHCSYCWTMACRASWERHRHSVIVVAHWIGCCSGCYELGFIHVHVCNVLGIRSVVELLLLDQLLPFHTEVPHVSHHICFSSTVG